MLSQTEQKLADLFLKFPSIGRRTAQRFVFYLSQASKQEVKEIISAMVELKTKVKTCPTCFKTFEGPANFCEICSDKTRNQQAICLVEKEQDLLLIESTHKFRGLYFILGGLFNKYNKKQLEERAALLLSKIRETNVKEVLMALSQTEEGRITSLFMERRLHELPPNTSVKITHLAVGLPIGAELEYANPETLSQALDNRR